MFPNSVANTNTRFEVKHDAALAIKTDILIIFFFRKSDEKEEPLQHLEEGKTTCRGLSLIWSLPPHPTCPASQA